MGLFSIKGHVTAIGQHQILKDAYIYHWIECEDSTGQRINVSNVAVTNEVLSLFNVGMAGELYFESLGSKKQLFGIKTAEGQVAYEETSMRGKIAGTCILAGIPLLYIWGMGIPFILFGLFLLITQGPFSRKKCFYGSDQQEAERLRRQVPIRS